MSEQMALEGSITSRAPQRYLIHNLAGIPLWYWVPGVKKVRLLQTDEPSCCGHLCVLLVCAGSIWRLSRRSSTALITTDLIIAQTYRNT